ncbi:MAG: ABC-2 family transporter protein [Spirochaetales bacterium]|nr:ABC-2 family transporter protein [Spirochaetales bacterium]
MKDRLFPEIIRVAFKSLFQYRWTFAVTVLTQPFVLLLNMALFQSIYTYNQTEVIKGYGYVQMVWYFLSFMIVNAFVWNATTIEMSHKILSGDLTGDLLKPVSVLTLELGSSIASRIIAVIMDFLPTIVICSLILFPSFLTPWSFLRFLIVIIPAFFLNFFTAYIMGMAALILKNNSSLYAVNNLFAAFAGGAFIPLEFFPGWANTIVAALPFKYIFYWPIMCFLNKAPADEWTAVLGILKIQLIWCAVLFAAALVLWKRLVAHYCAAGG